MKYYRQYKEEVNRKEAGDNYTVNNFIICTLHLILLKVKVKVSRLHAMMAPGGRGGIAPTNSQPRH
jgi:hypothetical protein